MNPVLLKPNSDTGSQVIIQGRAIGNMKAAAYHDYKKTALGFALESYRRLAARYQVVLVEGAGSPAEINLRANDLANMGFAEAVNCPVLLTADIDRGGVFAHLVGTLEVLAPSERARVAGVVINRFRGDPALLRPGLDWLEQRCGKAVWGVLPYLPGLRLEAEDSLSLNTAQNEKSNTALKICVLLTPRLSNHTDFDPLLTHPQTQVLFARQGEALPACDLIIIGGSKSARADLNFIRENGWENQILRHLRYGGKVLGLCGGFQMLGRQLHDPLGLEGQPGSSAGLGLLDLETSLSQEKQLRNVRGHLAETLMENAKDSPTQDQAINLSAYEIHCGHSSGPALQRPLTYLGEEQRPEGAVSPDNQVAGTYLHGLFEEPAACAALLAWAGLKQAQQVDYRALRESEINRLADAAEEHLDIEKIYALLKI